MNCCNWILAPVATGPVQELARELKISITLAKLLIARGFNTAEAARTFLSPSLDQLHDPMLLPQMDLAVHRIQQALDQHEKMLVYGDYDVDGTTGAALLTRVLRALKANVIHRVPHRQLEGYDLHVSTIDDAKKSGVSLIVTVDCGSSALEAVNHARELGIDVVITDHHEPGPTLPSAIAVVNPRRHDSKYPFDELAGVGVALKLAQALSRSLGLDEKMVLLKFCDLAALGTVGDVMPLVNENRVIVNQGLQSMPTTQKLGLRALAQLAGVEGKKPDTYHLSFGMAPRLNAVGRMGDANLALELLLTRDALEASNLARQLEEANRQRQEEQARILEEALTQASSYNLDDTRVMVLSSSGWHPGVIGIVASKIVEAFQRPAILISEDGDIGRGSCRSIEKFHIHDALCECGDLLGRFGGHAMAAGFDIPLAQLELFRSRINEVGHQRISEQDMVPRIKADVILKPEQVGIRLAEELERLAPFGPGNPRPIFVTEAVELAGCTAVGSDRAHLKLRVVGENSVPIDCMGWRMGDLCAELEIGERYDLCYGLEINHFNGNRNAQMVLKGIRPCAKINEPLSLASAKES